MFMSLKQLVGFDVSAIDGHFGTVSDCLISQHDRVVRYLVIDPQKWNPLSQKVLLSPVSVYYINLDKKEINLSITQEQVKTSPGVEEQETVSRHFEAQLYKHYGYGYYWMGTDLWGVSSDPSVLKLPTDTDEIGNSEEEIDLRSIKEITKYSCQCVDGSLHGFQDVIFDSKNWSLPYIVIDIEAALLSDNLSVVRQEALTDIRWQEQKVHIQIDKHQLAANPHYDALAINSDAFLAMMNASPWQP